MQQHWGGRRAANKNEQRSSTSAAPARPSSLGEGDEWQAAAAIVATSLVDEWISFRVREGLRNIYMEWVFRPAIQRAFFACPNSKWPKILSGN